MLRAATALLAIFFPLDLFAKCAPPLENQATIEILSCQGVTFMASKSKYEFYNSGEHDILHIPGESLYGALIVGKVIDAKEIDSKRASNLNKAVWKNSEIRNFFVALPSTEACPTNLPESKRVVEQV